MKKLMLLMFVLFPLHSEAHPVIYKGGWALSSFNMPDFSNNYVMYSVNNLFALGLDQYRFEKNDQTSDIGLFKVNHLLWRHNGEDSQASIYLHGGVGLEDQKFTNSVLRASYLGGVEADWETRKLYTSAKYFQFQNIAMTQARIGLSPKEAPFENLQTWFMLQGMHLKGVNETVSLTPMLRFFYQNVLWEMGSSTKGDWMLNLMVHY